MSEIIQLKAGETSPIGKVYGQIQAIPQSTFVATPAVDEDGITNEPITMTLVINETSNGNWTDITCLTGILVLYPESEGSGGGGAPVDKQFVIDSGGNYHNLELEGNILVLTNTNAQAIFTGFDFSVYKSLTIINNGAFPAVLNNEDPNSDANKQIKLPTGLASIGIEGSSQIIYVESIEKGQIVDSFASKYRPEHRGLTESMVEVVNTNAESETHPMIDAIVFRDAQSTPMSHADLEAAYPVDRGIQVVCEQINTIYFKTKTSPAKWEEITTTTVV